MSKVILEIENLDDVMIQILKDDLAILEKDFEQVMALDAKEYKENIKAMKVVIEYYGG